MAPKKAASLIGLEELTNNKNGLGKALVAEAIGVFFINYFGCLSCLKPTSQSLSLHILKPDEPGNGQNVTITSDPIDSTSHTVIIALSFGLVIFTLIQVSIRIPLHKQSVYCNFHRNSIHSKHRESKWVLEAKSIGNQHSFYREFHAFRKKQISTL